MGIKNINRQCFCLSGHFPQARVRDYLYSEAIAYVMDGSSYLYPFLLDLVNKS